MPAKDVVSTSRAHKLLAGSTFSPTRSSHPLQGRNVCWNALRCATVTRRRAVAKNRLKTVREHGAQMVKGIARSLDCG